MVSDSDFKALQTQVAQLTNLLRQKVLGNDPSTNLGLSSQAVNFGGPPQAGSLTLQLNGVETSINNSIDPDLLGETVSLESIDIAIANGDKTALTPDGIFVLAWDVTIPGYKQIAFVADDGTGSGRLVFAQVGTGNQIDLNTAAPSMSVTDGVDTSLLSPTGIIVKGAVGVSGAVTAGGHTLTFTNGILTAFV